MKTASTLAASILTASSLHAGAAGLDGRWQGVLQVPGAAQPIVLDLAGGIGSVTLPGRGASGAPLRDVSLGADRVRASLAAAIPTYGDGVTAPTLELERQPDGRLAGTFRLGGLAAPVVLQRSGDAQLAPAPASTPISPALAGIWRGRYELFGSPREVTLRLAAGSPGTAELVIVGRRTTNVPIDRIVQGPAWLTLESGEMGLTVEGRWSADTIAGTLVQGPIEVPLELRRDGGAK